ncbi:MAG: hypothetical protein BGP05_10675 [Rhizobiales bacterium 62-47]|mgnify:CR=1 FL=1|nr:hypothetical protein [Hyphomicrobiales bacterium]OJY12275.1 MAG: hypothetical protein BGP05_10675 [Rhizobiales bacterium 62-47]
MKSTTVFALAVLVAAPTLASFSPAQAASECPATGSLSGWGVNSTVYFDITSGGTCLFPIRLEGEVKSSRISQKPAHGTLKRLNLSTFQYTAKPGYKGADVMAITATGKGPTSSGTSSITANATVR